VNGCYKVVNRNLNWTDARQACHSLHKDAHLLIIDDADEQDAVAAMLQLTSRQYIHTQNFIHHKNGRS